MLVVVACGATPGAGFAEAEIALGEEVLTVWIATEPAERQQGLMEVDRLPPRLDGMLFVYQTSTSVTFTMFNTPMPLDIWWLDGEGVLIGSAEMEPCFSKPCTSYRSPGPIQWVLETPQGQYDFQSGVVLSTIDIG